MHPSPVRIGSAAARAFSPRAPRSRAFSVLRAGNPWWISVRINSPALPIARELVTVSQIHPARLRLSLVPWLDPPP
jgi:hypothetical protein